jgi:hypothetical protein
VLEGFALRSVWDLIQGSSSAFTKVAGNRREEVKACETLLKDEVTLVARTSREFW